MVSSKFHILALALATQGIFGAVIPASNLVQREPDPSKVTERGPGYLIKYPDAEEEGSVDKRGPGYLIQYSDAEEEGSQE